MQICDHTGLQNLQGSILSLQPSIVRAISPPCPWLHFEPLKLLNFDFNADLDPTFPWYADLEPDSKINADPDPQPYSQDYLALKKLPDLPP